MFGQNKSAPKQKTFNLTSEQVSEDIRTICSLEANRSLLFECIDRKAPEYKRIEEIRELLRGGEQLDEAKKMLQDNQSSLERLRRKLELSINKIYAKIDSNNSAL